MRLLGPRLSRVPSWCSLSLRFSSLVTGAHNHRSQRLPRNLPPGRVELHPPKGGSGGGDRRERRYLPGDAYASDPVLALRLLPSLSGTPFSSHPQRFDLATQLRFAQPLLVTLVYELEIHHPTHPGFSSFRRLIRPSLCTFAHSTPRWKARSTRFHLSPTLALAGMKSLSNSEHLPTLPPISFTGTVLMPRWILPIAPGILLRSSKQRRTPSEAFSLRKRFLIRRSSALRRAREKSASTCSSRFMYLTIDEILSSVFQMPLQSVNRSPEGLCFLPCPRPPSGRPRSSQL